MQSGKDAKSHIRRFYCREAEEGVNAKMQRSCFTGITGEDY